MSHATDPSLQLTGRTHQTVRVRRAGLHLRFLHVGAPTHGVTRFGAELATAVADLDGVDVHSDHGPAPSADRPGWRRHRPGTVQPAITQLQFTDNLWGRDAADAARALTSTTAAIDGPVVATLHDLPDPDDEPGRYARRADSYAAVARVADRVVVCSHHEAHRLRLIAPDITPTVIPNPLPLAGAAAAAPRGRMRPARRPVPTVGLLGWIYPGKGHGSVLRSLAGRADLHVVALGAIAEGHDDHLRALTARARALGVAFSATGWLDDGRQRRLACTVDVPVAAHPRPSASGTMLTWIAAGRRPLVRRSPYAEELAARAPGAVTLYDRTGLADVVDLALHDPASTRLDVRPLAGELAPATAARRYRQLYEELR